MQALVPRAAVRCVALLSWLRGWAGPRRDDREGGPYATLAASDRPSPRMPELPDIEAYCAAIRSRLVGVRLDRLRILDPFLLRTVEPASASLEGGELRSCSRIGKRIALHFDGGSAVIHLMIAGRLHLAQSSAKVPRRAKLSFDTAHGSLWLSEAGSKRRASLHLFTDQQAALALDPGGLEPLTCTQEEFVSTLRAHAHTIKRALTDPRIFSGIGNAYSDEILFDARMSPTALTRTATDPRLHDLFVSTRRVLGQWVERRVGEAVTAFPEHVTAFEPDFAVHGRRGMPCRRCGDPIQRVAYADRELNYCPGCQTEGKILADRALSRLLGKDFPRSLDALEEYLRVRRDKLASPPSREASAKLRTTPDQADNGEA